MADTDFAKAITQAARTVARIELRRRKLRGQLADLDGEYRTAQRELRLLVQSCGPYAPPSSEQIQDARTRDEEF